MARRTKAQIRADKIAATEARIKEADALLRELKREAAKEEKAKFDAAVLDLGRWLASETGASSLDEVAALREVLSDANTLQSIRDKVAAISGDRDAGLQDAASVVGDAFGDDEPAESSTDGGTGGSTETEASKWNDDDEDEVRSSHKQW